jgi:aerobic-type carbon monoxide dehydrogenase small subunit (CoxS/CutS family)
MAAKAFLDHNPNPTYEEVKEGLCGNLCRCGTYVGVRKAVLEAPRR